MLEQLGTCTCACEREREREMHPCSLQGEDALQLVVGRCSPSGSPTSSPWKLLVTVRRGGEMRKARGEITCETHPGFISPSAIKMTLLA